MINFLPLLIIVVILIYLWYVFTIVYHFIRFGIGRLPKIVALVFFIISIFILIISIFLLLYFGRISQNIILEKIINVSNFLKFLKVK